MKFSEIPLIYLNNKSYDYNNNINDIHKNIEFFNIIMKS